RRLIRRAVRHGRTLGLKTEDYLNIAAVYIDKVYTDSYPLLTKQREFIMTELKKEIERFESTIENGMKEYKKILDTNKAKGSKKISGAEAFYLYDTFGFPLELTVEMASEEGLTVSEEEFKASMEEQKQKARENSNFAQKALDNDAFEKLDASIVSEFVGYDKTELEETIKAMSDNEEIVDTLNGGEEGTLVFAKTPFYATMGGQKGDIGKITTSTGVFEVEETVKLPGNRIGHIGKVLSGTVKTGDKAKLEVNKSTRNATCKNHSATHLLQAALQEVLGDHVEQQGSYQDSQRTRFDFSHSQAMTKEEIEKVEAIVNEKINEALDVTTEVMSIEEAKKTGAMALFGEKYGESVRVVSMGDFSKELCGGTHVKNTSDIANFKILSESGVAAGVRRIEAITGANVIAYYKNVEEELNKACATVKTQPSNLLDRLSSLMAEVKALNSEVESLKAKAAKDALGDPMDAVCEVKGVKLLATSVPGVDMNGLRDLADQLADKLGEGVIVLASEADGKVNLVSKATDAAQAKGAHAGNLIKAIATIVGGGGGGRPNMAQAGGKNPAGIPDAIKEAKNALEGMLK
ncbi:MAG: alanine--tRNA ligase, partial [Lachnospiraceae bacterium]|nr:alanine--tRNA ligase [Lachnospiraceae bacterium]